MTLTLVLKKGFAPRNVHVKYESPKTCHSKAMANVKVDKQTDTETGQKLYAPIYRCGG